MRLLSIGSSPSCGICISNEYVSSYHAELLLLDNGDIFISDCGSRNGTFLEGKRLQPNVEVPCKRGDRIEFDNVPLNWAKVPVLQTPDPSKIIEIYGVGKSQRNKQQLSGEAVSRYHATFKHMKNGKWFIQDHSKNGTFINGQRITSNQDYQIRKGDSIVCGNISCPNPVISYIPAWWPAPVIAVAVAAIVLLFMLLGPGPVVPAEPSIESLEKATVWVYGQYFIDVTFDDDPLGNNFSSIGWPTKWEFGVGQDKRIRCQQFYSGRVRPISYSGTAFFISENGELGTNRHIAVPWDYITEEESDAVRQEMQMFLNSNNAIKLLVRHIKAGVFTIEEAQAMLDRYKKSPMKISGHHEYLGIGLTQTQLLSTEGELSRENLQRCQVIAESGDSRRDVALLRLNTPATPANIQKSGYFNLKSAKTDYSKLHSQDEITTIGYHPMGLSLGMTSFRDIAKELRPTTRRTFISKSPNSDMFEIQMNVIGGASGSPVLDRKRHLVGVAFGSVTNQEIGYVCNIKYLQELYERYKY